MLMFMHVWGWLSFISSMFSSTVSISIYGHCKYAPRGHTEDLYDLILLVIFNDGAGVGMVREIEGKIRKD